VIPHQGAMLRARSLISLEEPSTISNATVSLHEPQAGRIVYGQLAGLSLAAGKSTQVNGSFRVPQALYQSWQKGSSPAMSVTYSDAQGNSVQTFIQF